MKNNEFKKLLADCITSPKGAPIWSCAGYALLRLTEKQVEILRHAVQANPAVKRIEDGAVMLPNGIILQKLTKTFRIYVNDLFHHDFDAWNVDDAIEYARKKSALYGHTAIVKLYGEKGGLIAVCYLGAADTGVQP